MKRPRGSLLAYPADHVIRPDENALYDMSQIEKNGIYSKLVLADRSQVMTIIERESAELRAQILEDENCTERCFIEQAITLLRDREGFVLNGGTVEVSEENKRVNIEKCEGTIDEEDDNVAVEDLDISQSGSSQQQQPTKYHYFYQGNVLVREVDDTREGATLWIKMRVSFCTAPLF